MKESISKITRMDDWVFEVKMVRALKVSKHGEPYSAVATLTAAGEQMYIDTQLTKDGAELSRKDFATIYSFCQSLNMKQITYDRIKDGVRSSKVVDINENTPPKPYIRLVK
jgi:hypothetical protein